MANQYPLICLVGENPLPIYLSILQYAEEITKVILVHSKETMSAAKNIKRVAVHSKLELEIDLILLAEPYKPSCVEGKMKELYDNNPGSRLNYTGGTKVMSAFAVRVWKTEADMLYLNEGSSCFQLADGSQVPLNDIGMSIDDICGLHGIPTCDQSSNEFENTINDEKLHELYSKWIETKDRSPFLPDQWENFSINGCDPVAEAERRWKEFQVTFNLFAEIPPPPSKNQFSDGKNKKIYRFAATAWMEMLVESIVRKCTHSSIRRGVTFDIQGQQFESDVMTVHNNRLMYFSVTTSSAEKLVKSKMFEAIYRSQQIGGGMARTAVVCLAEEAGRNKARDSFGNPARIEFFGQTDMNDWIKDDYESLKSFLKK